MRRLLLIFIAGASLALSSSGAVAAERTLAIVGATLIHPEREPEHAVVADSTVVMSGSRIRAVGPTASTPLPQDAIVIDGRGKWIVPGLIDAHVHIAISGNLYARPDIADFTRWMPFEQEVARHLARLAVTFKVWLASGVTGVVDIGGPLWNFHMRDLARDSDAAPRVVVAGPLISTIARPQLDLGDPPIVRIDTPEQARALVQSELPYRPDYIKMWFIHDPGDDLSAQTAVARAAGEAAHAAGVPFAVHATELDVAKAALHAGADFLVHSVGDQPVDEEFLALARQRNVIYCPTLFVSQGYELALSNRWRPTPAELRLADPVVVAAMFDLERIPRETIPKWVQRLMQAPPRDVTEPAAMENLRRVWQAGIPVVMGSDAGNIGTLHGPAVFRELALMVRAGLTPLQALRAATTNGALAMRMADEIGVIAPGRLADLLILDADPLQDEQNLSRIHRVIKDGRVYDPLQLIAEIRSTP